MSATSTTRSNDQSTTSRATVADKYRGSTATVVLPAGAAGVDDGALDHEERPRRQLAPADQIVTGRAKAVDQSRNFTEPIAAVPGGAMSIAQFCFWASIGRTKLYSEVRAGRIKLRKIGTKSVVIRSDGENWLRSLPTA
jgi:hypothetical protein